MTETRVNIQQSRKELLTKQSAEYKRWVKMGTDFAHKLYLDIETYLYACLCSPSYLSDMYEGEHLWRVHNMMQMQPP